MLDREQGVSIQPCWLYLITGPLVVRWQELWKNSEQSTKGGHDHGAEWGANERKWKWNEYVAQMKGAPASVFLGRLPQLQITCVSQRTASLPMGRENKRYVCGWDPIPDLMC